MTCNILLTESNNQFRNSENLFFRLKSFTSFVFHQKQSDLFIKLSKYLINNLITLWVSEKIANRFWWFNFSYLETDIPPKDKKLWYIFVGSKKKQYISHIKLNCNWMMMCFSSLFPFLWFFKAMKNILHLKLERKIRFWIGPSKMKFQKKSYYSYIKSGFFLFQFRCLQIINWLYPRKI